MPKASDIKKKLERSYMMSSGSDIVGDYESETKDPIQSSKSLSYKDMEKARQDRVNILAGGIKKALKKT